MDWSVRSPGWGPVAVALCVLGTFGFAPEPGVAQEGFQAPFIERGLGATNMVATAGNGSLTAGISKDGDLTMLSWPSPSYYDQLHYVTSNAADARQQPRYGAPERAGAFAGLVVREKGVSESTVTWLRNWDRSVTYAREDVRVVETTFTSESLGLSVVQRDSIPEERDVLVRRYRVEVTGETEYESIDLIGYSNLTTNLSKSPQVPLLGVLMDHKNDFMAVWNDAEEAIVHFQPEGDWVVRTITEATAAINGTLGREFGPLGDLLTEEEPDPSEVQTVAQDLDGNYGSGVYAAMSSEPAPKEYQVGEDETEFCKNLKEISENIASLTDEFPDRDLPADPGVAELIECGSFDPVESVRSQESWEYTAQDAFDDVGDAELSGNPVAGGQVNAAVRVELLRGAGEMEGEGALYYAFGETSDEATSALEWARNEGARSLEQKVIAADESFIEDLWIPAEVDGDLEKFIERAFLNLKVGTDDETGAIVASISRQPSYQLDWPRDGAFFNTALDLSGQHDLVSKRMQFYSGTIREEPASPHPLLNPEGVPGWPSDGGQSDFPADSWEMNYYADGVVGGNIRLEIDNSALLVWAYVAHAGFLEGEERSDYLDRIWPVLERATNFIHRWRDPETGLMWPANEDDHANFTQGFQGASTSYRALVDAARVAKHRGEEELAEKWLERAGELHAATMRRMADEEYGFKDFEEEGSAAGRAWLAWPTRFLPFDNERLVETTEQVLDKELAGVRGERGNGLYPTKVAISASLALPEGDEDREKAIEIAERLASEIANQQTWMIGETYAPLDEDGDGATEDFVNAVSTPHLWSAILVYITTVAYYHPERFDPHREFLPQVSVPEVKPPGVPGGDAGDAGSVDAAPDGAGSGSEGAGDGSSGESGCRQVTGSSGPPAAIVVALGLVALVRLRGSRDDEFDVGCDGE